MAGVEIRVRMYKRILGDCFLIMAGRDGKQANILIDCGVLQGVSGDKLLMQAVAADIVEATRGEDGRSVIHLLVVTHEHHDHISGFAHARETFLDAGSALTIERLWMGWTESPDDPVAAQLRRRFRTMKMAVVAADAYVKRLAKDDKVTLAEMEGLEDFVGPVDEALAATSGRMTGARTMEALKAKALAVDYVEPGEVRKTPGPVSLRAYVLAPPRNLERLFKDLPSKGADQETYLSAMSLATEAFALSLDSAARDCQPGSPFSRRHLALTVKEAEGLASPRRRRRGDDPLNPLRDLYARYFKPSQEQRRIDKEWTGAAGHLALKLDSDTNNGSLVLAFELGDTPGQGEVMLFAADAQVGNWLSWHDQAYPENEDKDKAGIAEVGKVTAESLLNRTSLYKVGHHASHNATLKKKGLELMIDDRLVAMIPVVSAVSDTKKGWHMPHVPLLERLVAKTQGRVLRGDCAMGVGLAVKDGKIDYENRMPVGPAFEGRVKVCKATNPATGKKDEFWVEYRVA